MIETITILLNIVLAIQLYRANRKISRLESKAADYRASLHMAYRKDYSVSKLRRDGLL